MPGNPASIFSSVVIITLPHLQFWKSTRQWSSWKWHWGHVYICTRTQSIAYAHNLIRSVRAQRVGKALPALIYLKPVAAAASMLRASAQASYPCFTEASCTQSMTANTSPLLLWANLDCCHLWYSYICCNHTWLPCILWTPKSLWMPGLHTVAQHVSSICCFPATCYIFLLMARNPSIMEEKHDLMQLIRKTAGWNAAMITLFESSS